MQKTPLVSQLKINPLYPEDDKEVDKEIRPKKKNRYIFISLKDL